MGIFLPLCALGALIELVKRPNFESGSLIQISQVHSTQGAHARTYMLKIDLNPCPKSEPPKSLERNRAEAMNRLVGRVASLEAAVETLEGSMGTSVGGTTQTCQQLFRVARVLHE